MEITLIVSQFIHTLLCEVTLNLVRDYGGLSISVFSMFDKLSQAEYSRFRCNSRIYRYLRFLAHLASIDLDSFVLLVSTN